MNIFLSVDGDWGESGGYYLIIIFFNFAASNKNSKDMDYLQGFKALPLRANKNPCTSTTQTWH